jgi:uncharacterized damage-inducible protein DinB
MVYGPWSIDFSSMNREILLIAEKIKDTHQGDPWFGRNVQSILSEINEDMAFRKISGQHSILELLWHMITWKEFTVSRLREDDKNMTYFESIDWRELDHSNRSLWQQGLERFNEIHNELVTLVQQQKDEILSRTINERTYDFRKLLYGIIEHDIYHLGQIAYIKKLLSSKV